MRHHDFCFNKASKGVVAAETIRNLFSIEYLIHDFEAMCRTLQPSSKKILIDMGAELDFAGDRGSPVIDLLQLYEKFGIHFDHIYGFEVKEKDAKKIFGELLPEKYMHVYHWMNVGVSSEVGDKLNPLHSILEKFTEDDLVIVKLDIDTASIEVPLVKQLLSGGLNGIYHRLVDQFYFEHHVHLKDLAPYWGPTMNGTLKESLDIFYSLRKLGIPAHYWP